jgi:murein DD-endopeptidase MepM/ murein hydrolase activator NlpD
MAKSAKDYPVTFPYGATSSPYSKAYPHQGDDRACPSGTPVKVNGVQIGLVGSTGWSTGPHLHVGKWANGRSYNPNKQGFSFKNAKVTEINQDSKNGKYVRVQADGYSWVYLHLSKQTAKVGQVLKAPVATPKPVYTTVRAGEGLSAIAKRAGYKDWWAPTAWIRLSKLNGKGVNWLAYNRSLKPGQKIRIK